MPVNNATANTQIDFLSGLMLPVGLFFTCGIIAIVGYFYTRVFWRSVLDLSRGGRFLFYSTSMFIVPAAITGLVDVIDLADLKSGTITKSQSALLSILAVLLVIYLYMHGCWFDRNEAQLNAQQKDVGANPS